MNLAQSSPNQPPHSSYPYFYSPTPPAQIFVRSHPLYRRILLPKNVGCCIVCLVCSDPRTTTRHHSLPLPAAKPCQREKPLRCSASLVGSTPDSSADPKEEASDCRHYFGWSWHDHAKAAKAATKTVGSGPYDGSCIGHGGCCWHLLVLVVDLLIVTFVVYLYINAYLAVRDLA